MRTCQLISSKLVDWADTHPARTAVIQPYAHGALDAVAVRAKGQGGSAETETGLNYGFRR